jgi:hypothetical protein
MKNTITSLLLFSAIITQAQVGIGVSTANINPSAQLDVTSTTKGLLAPRMTENQKNAINSPADGLLVYQTNGTKGFYSFDGSNWVAVGGSSFPSIVEGNNLSGTLIAGHNTLINLVNFQGASQSTGVGIGSLSSIESVQGVTALGYNSLHLNESASYNTAIGWKALNDNISGVDNTAVGSQSLENTTGTSNTAIGTMAMDTNIDGNRNTAIGTFSDVSSPDLDNATAIGYFAIVDADNTIQLGNQFITDVKTNGTVNTPAVNLTSDLRLKTNIAPLNQGMNAIMQLKPVSYEKKSSILSSNFNIKEFGFVAQELKKVLPTLVIEGTDKDKVLSVNYIALIPVLTKAIQEQQKEIEELKELVKQLANKK